MKRIKSKNIMISKNEGYSIIEVLFALTVLSIGLLGIFSLRAMTMKNNKLAVMHTKAAVLASDTMERLMALPYSDANLAAGDIDELISYGPLTQGVFSTTWSVTAKDLDGDLDEDLKKITATVDYATSKGGKPRTISFSFNKAKILF